MLGCATAEPEVYTFNVGKPAQWDSGTPADLPVQPSDNESSCEIPSGSENSSPLELEGRVTCGEEVFLNRCAGCHGSNGEGTAQGQVLNGFIDDQDNGTLLYSFQFGEGDMPPQNLQPQDAADVLAYIRTEFGN